MNPSQRKSYFLAWADVCRVQGWPAKDNAKRQQVTVDCMVAVRGPAVISTSELAEDEITALFCYLRYLVTGDADLVAAARWVDCQQDYKAFARARNADWHEERLYGKGKNKLDRDRFGGATSAQGEPLEAFDPEAIRKRHITMASRHQKKARQKGLPKPAAASPAVNAPAPVQAPAPAPAERASAPAMPTPEPITAAWDGEF